MSTLNLGTVKEVSLGGQHLSKLRHSDTVIWQKPIDYWGLTLTARVPSTVRFVEAPTDTILYSTNGSTWSSLSTAPVSLYAGESMYLKVDGTSTAKIGKFAMTGQIAASGNVMSLVNGSEPTTTISVERQFEDLFRNCACLVKAPELPATELSNYCYQNMFRECWRLPQAPDLPATRSSVGCYSGMFIACSALLQAPALPATELSNYCYQSMFGECTSITKTPVLPATTLAKACYYGMFRGCSKLSEVTVHVTDWDSSATVMWLSDVASTGTFNNMGNADVPIDNTSGCPLGWTLHNPYWGLTFTAEEPSTVCFVTAPQSPILYSRDEVIWSPLGTDPISLSTGESMFVKVGNAQTRTPQFVMTGRIAASGSIMSLVNGSGPQTDIDLSYQFKDTFKDCTSLTQAPNLPSTYMQPGCYQYMFQGCTSLTKAPELPSTKMVSCCYQSMFQGCTNLTQVPDLPATTLAGQCYLSMFQGCTSLVKAPALYGTELITGCYQYMFRGCSSLNEVTLHATGSWDWLATSGWLSDVASSGTIHNLGGAKGVPSGVNGCPTGWTVLSN